MKYYFIFIIVFILLYFLYDTMNLNVEYFKTSKFDIDKFNGFFDKKLENKKQTIDSLYNTDENLDTIYYRTPYKNNSLIINDIADEGILKNLRFLHKINNMQLKYHIKIYKKY